MNDPVSIARTAVEAGFNPIPLRPRAKRPVYGDWTNGRPDEALDRFTEAREKYDSLNIGLALGEGEDGVVDVDLDDHRAVRVARMMMPDTPMRHGRASARNSHYWYRTTGPEQGTKQYRLPDGSMVAEYRAKGAQTMIPPSYNPDHDEEVIWEGEPFGGDSGPSSVPAQQLRAVVGMIALLVTLADEWPKRGGRHDAYLALAGSLLRDAEEDGSPRVHPFWDAQIEGLIGHLATLTHDEDGARARIAESVHTTRSKIVSGGRVWGWPSLARIIGEEHTSAARRVVADIEQVVGMPRRKVRQSEEDWYEDGEASTLRAVPDDLADSPEVLEEEDEEERGTWAIVKRHSEWLDSSDTLIRPVLPGVLWRSDGEGVFYPGRINMIYGASESGKSLIAMTAALRVISEGGKALMVDLENGYDEIHERLQSLGSPAGQRTPGWGYIEAEQPMATLQRDSWGQEAASPSGRRNRERFMADLNDFDPNLLIVDGTTSLFTMHGLDPNKATGVDTITTWFRTLCDHGRRTVILIDHSNKKSGPGDLPTGSQHKKSMVQGTMLQVYGEAPERGQSSTAFLYVIKDRPGKVKRHGYRDPEGETRACDVTFESSPDDESIRIFLDPPDPDTTILDLSMNGEAHRGPGRPRADRGGDTKKVLTVFRQHGIGTLLSRSDVEAGLATAIPEGRVREAIKVLLDAGSIEQSGKGRSTAYALTPSGTGGQP